MGFHVVNNTANDAKNVHVEDTILPHTKNFAGALENIGCPVVLNMRNLADYHKGPTAMTSHIEKNLVMLALAVRMAYTRKIGAMDESEVRALTRSVPDHRLHCNHSSTMIWNIHFLAASSNLPARKCWGLARTGRERFRRLRKSLGRLSDVR